MPYSATTVFPLDVWAQTRTLFLCSKRIILRFWKSSNSKGNLIARFSIKLNSDVSILSSSAYTIFFSASFIIVFCMWFNEVVMLSSFFRFLFWFW